jgi:transcriptional regulator with XRE-family HTH domain
MNIGEYVRSRRLKGNLTLRQLSDLSGLSPTLIFNLETGKSDPKLGSIEKVAIAFGQSVPLFLGRFYSRQRRTSSKAKKNGEALTS